MNYKVNGSCLRYIVPFSFPGSFEMAITKVERGNFGKVRVWEPEVDTTYRSDLYDYVRSEFHFKKGSASLSAGKMGCRWMMTGSRVLNENTDKYNSDESCILDLRYFPSKNSKKAIPLKVKNIGLALFRNGLGFFWFDINWCTKTFHTNQLVAFQKMVRNLNTSEAFLWNVCEKDDPLALPITLKGEESLYAKPFQFGNYIARTLRFLQVTFLSERDSAYSRLLSSAFSRLKFSQKEKNEYIVKATENEPMRVPKKAVLFTYCSMGEIHEDIDVAILESERQKMAYYLANGYDQTYHMSKQIADTMRHPFEDAIWFATQEGAVYLTWPMQDHKHFCDTVLPEKVEYDYFTMYLKLLYQSYSLFLYAQRIQEEISMDDFNNEVQNEKENHITALMKEVQLFLTKSMATSVSNVHHQTEFYIYVKKVLRIEEDVHSVLSGLEAFASLQREERYQQEKQAEKAAEREEKSKEEAEKSRDEKVQAGVGFLAVLTVFSAWTDVYDYISKFGEGEGTWSNIWAGNQILFWAEIVGAVLVLAIGTFASIHAYNAIRIAAGKDSKKVTRKSENKKVVGFKKAVGKIAEDKKIEDKKIAEDAIEKNAVKMATKEDMVKTDTVKTGAAGEDPIKKNMGKTGTGETDKGANDVDKRDIVKRDRTEPAESTQEDEKNTKRFYVDSIGIDQKDGGDKK